MKRIITRITGFEDSSIKEIIDNIPDEIMSSNKKTLAIRLLSIRRERLKEMI